MAHRYSDIQRPIVTDASDVICVLCHLWRNKMSSSLNFHSSLNFTSFFHCRGLFYKWFNVLLLPQHQFVGLVHTGWFHLDATVICIVISLHEVTQMFHIFKTVNVVKILYYSRFYCFDQSLYVVCLHLIVCHRMQDVVIVKPFQYFPCKFSTWICTDLLWSSPF